ncbi:MAG: DNA-3-methyladenine glycosylase 2 family protein [Rhodospirillales bacterium]|nr:DNA-3-methyladenine glycosylase 2 family protein [Rhodospirillales bacterium]
MAADLSRSADRRSAGPAGFPEPPAHARQALSALVAQDPLLGRIEAAAGPLPWRRRAAGFAGLLQAIIGQQISNRAAAAIWSRLAARPEAHDPWRFAALGDDDLRADGLSRPKMRHARALATAITEGRLDLDALPLLDDEAAIAAISAIPGMGRWTAEVYLLFALERADIFPAGDLALAAALADLRGLDARPRPPALRAMAEAWQPWRGLAARLLWHHWRHVTGRPAMDDVLAGPLPR